MDDIERQKHLHNLDWFSVNKSWLVKAAMKYQSHDQGLELFDRIEELGRLRDKLTPVRQF